MRINTNQNNAKNFDLKSESDKKKQKTDVVPQASIGEIAQPKKQLNKSKEPEPKEPVKVLKPA